MPLENQNFELFAGDHKKIIYDVENFDATEAEEVIWSSGVIEKEKSDMNITESEISFNINTPETEGLHGRYRYVLKIIDNIGNVSTLASGTMLVK